MTSAPIRDQVADHLLTPQNSAFLVIDYQPSQFAAVRSMDTDLLRKNIVSTVKTAAAFNLPIVHSTVNVAAGQGNTVPELAELLGDNPAIDRTTVNSWDDVGFLACRACNRAPEAHLLRAVDRGLHGLHRPRRATRRVRGVSGCRRNRWHVSRSASGRPRTCRSSGWPADQLGVVGVRTSARLGSQGNDGGGL